MSPRILTDEHKAKMQAGRRKAKEHRGTHAEQRVSAYKAWLRAGCPLDRVPEIPSDADYRLAGSTK